MSECEEGSLLHAMVSSAPRVLAMRLPISSGGVLTHDGEPVLYRCILLPLSEADGHIDGLLAAASYRTVAMTEEIHPIDEWMAAPAA